MLTCSVDYRIQFFRLMNHYMFPVGSNFKWKYNKWSSSLKISQPEFCAQKRGKKNHGWWDCNKSLVGWWACSKSLVGWWDCKSSLVDFSWWHGVLRNEARREMNEKSEFWVALEANSFKNKIPRWLFGIKFW